MKHATNRALYAYWDNVRGRRRAPERADIEPGDIRTILGDTFILAVDSFAGHPFRLAGTRVCALFARETKGEPFVELWDEDDRGAVRELLAAVTDEATGIIAGVNGETGEGVALPLEMLLLPLAQRGRTNARVIGALAPLEIPYWLGQRPLAALRLGPLRYVGPAIEAVRTPRFAAGTEAARARGGLVIYDGGRPD